MPWLRPRERRNWPSSNVCRKPWRTPATSPSCGRPRRTCGAGMELESQVVARISISPDVAQRAPGDAELDPTLQGRPVNAEGGGVRPASDGPAQPVHRGPGRGPCPVLFYRSIAPYCHASRADPRGLFRRHGIQVVAGSAWTAVRCRLSRTPRDNGSPPPGEGRRFPPFSGAQPFTGKITDPALSGFWRASQMVAAHPTPSPLVFATLGAGDAASARPDCPAPALRKSNGALMKRTRRSLPSRAGRSRSVAPPAGPPRPCTAGDLNRR